VKIPRYGKYGQLSVEERESTVYTQYSQMAAHPMNIRVLAKKTVEISKGNGGGKEFNFSSFTSNLTNTCCRWLSDLNLRLNVNVLYRF
jgi:hypothetical protein